MVVVQFQELVAVMVLLGPARGCPVEQEEGPFTRGLLRWAPRRRMLLGPSLAGEVAVVAAAGLRTAPVLALASPRQAVRAPLVPAPGAGWAAVVVVVMDQVAMKQTQRLSLYRRNRRFTAPSTSTRGGGRRLAACLAVTGPPRAWRMFAYLC